MSTIKNNNLKKYVLGDLKHLIIMALSTAIIICLLYKDNNIQNVLSLIHNEKTHVILYLVIAGIVCTYSIIEYLMKWLVFIIMIIFILLVEIFKKK